jgi:hypothetical protein
MKDQVKSKLSSRKEIINLTVEINDIENRKAIKEITKTKHWFFANLKK